ncbi:ribose-phosphate diphosphokinase family protein [Neorickettsia helminthoeca str. Oregon]|uniref:ribose-phosphate diphosphokinase n=1 Tax=Neorickettsia helminthoeca str. Oregon TaxID=1286528 RepID=X5HMK4_9RICK|nr:ribose-phosphate diphosphokinase [Neorickettsia helminthoeca]AHX11705.1 ribose-phosphate diphosphokinase family protein [Neorickettsia helminthoeca str. Oregon]
MKVILGSRSGELGQKVATLLGASRIAAEINRFPDGESNVIVNDPELLPGDKVLVIESLCNDGDIIEFLLIVDALNRRGIRDIVLVAPYFAYTRADRIVSSGSAIGAKVIADLVGQRISLVVTLDVHFSQFEGFFNIPVRNVLPNEILERSISIHSDVVIVAPDLGAVKRAKSLAEGLGLSLVIMNKYRSSPGVSEITDIIGEVEGRECVIVDDIVCGGGTLCNAAEKLNELGAKSVLAFVTHGVLSGKAQQRIMGSCIDEIIITDSIPVRKNEGKIRIASAAELIAKEIRSIY